MTHPELPPSNGVAIEEGTLFHRFRRYVKTDTERSDRLASVLERGLLAPSHDPDRVISDLKGNFTAVGTTVPYDSVIFLHRYNSALSARYLSLDTESVFVILKPGLAVVTPEEMPKPWIVSSRDEVYSLEPIAPGSIDTILLPNPMLEQVSKDMAAQLAARAIRLAGFASP